MSRPGRRAGRSATRTRPSTTRARRFRSGSARTPPRTAWNPASGRPLARPRRRARVSGRCPAAALIRISTSTPHSLVMNCGVGALCCGNEGGSEPFAWVESFEHAGRTAERTVVDIGSTYPPSDTGPAGQTVQLCAWCNPGGGRNRPRAGHGREAPEGVEEVVGESWGVLPFAPGASAFWVMDFRSCHR